MEDFKTNSVPRSTAEPELKNKDKKHRSTRISLDYKTLDALLQFKVTKKFCAEYMGITIDVIQRRLMQDHNTTFEEYHETKLNRTALKLQQKAIEMALTGDRTMLIFALKNLAGWSDKLETKQTNIDGGKAPDVSKLSDTEKNDILKLAVDEVQKLRTS